MTYQAFVVDLVADKPKATMTKREEQPLNDHDVQVQVAYSAINYKDALTLKAHSGVIRNFPRVPGVDFSGWVVASKNSRFHVGDKVAAIGWQIGIQIDGGYQELVNVPGDYLHLLSGERSLRDAVAIGTAGLTAAIGLTKVLAQPALADKNTPILITGATGGVGGWQLSILAALGYQNITAVTRQLDQTLALNRLGATSVIPPDCLITVPLKPLNKQKYAVIFDNIGGSLLAQLLPQVQLHGVVVASGNAGGIDLTTTVLPFILRGIALYGVDSVNYPQSDREEIWQLFETAFWPAVDRQIKLTEIPFNELLAALENFTTTPHFGRTLVRIRTRRPSLNL